MLQLAAREQREENHQFQKREWQKEPPLLGKKLDQYHSEKHYLLKLDEFEEKSEINLIFSEVNLLKQNDIDLIKSYVSIYQDVILNIYPRDHKLEGKHDSLEDVSDELEKGQTPYEITINDYAKVSGKWIRNVLVNLGLERVKEIKINKFDSN